MTRGPACITMASRHPAGTGDGRSSLGEDQGEECAELGAGRGGSQRPPVANVKILSPFSWPSMSPETPQIYISEIVQV